MTHSQVKLIKDIDEKTYWEWYHLDMELDYRYSYVHYGLNNEIQGHCRKDQRTYQRKFCSTYAKLKNLEDYINGTYTEYFI